MDRRHPSSESVPLRKKVYDSLHTDIVCGKIPGGERLIESSLASSMGVSRTPVREVLQQLTAEGYLNYIPRAGYIVEDMSFDDIKDLFETREEIEKVVVCRAAGKISPAEMEQLRANLVKTDEALQQGVTDQMIHLDTEFHYILYRATRSKTLFQISQNLSDRTLKFRIACIHFPDVAQRAREGHWRIYRALDTGGEDKVRQAVKAHLEETRKDIIRSFKKIREENFMNGHHTFRSF